MLFLCGDDPGKAGGAPTPLPEPQLLLSHWFRSYQGTGDSVRCFSACSSMLVPERVLEQIAVDTTWTPPAISGSVAWRLQVQAADSPGSGHVTETWSLGLHDPGPVSLGVVAFPDVEGPHCVSLVIEDLRSGEQRRGETCAKRGPLEGFTTDSQLASCNEPPNAGLTRAWCDLRFNRPPLCATAPTDDDAPPHDVTSSPSTDAHESGCQLGVPSGTGGLNAALAALAACAALRVRRRRGA